MKHHCFCFHYWDYLTNIRCNNWQSIFVWVKGLDYSFKKILCIKTVPFILIHIKKYGSRSKFLLRQLPWLICLLNPPSLYHPIPKIIGLSEQKVEELLASAFQFDAKDFFKWAGTKSYRIFNLRILILKWFICTKPFFQTTQNKKLPNI